MKKMYVLARKDLKGSQPWVQAIHAIAQYGIDHPDRIGKWNNHTLVVLSIKDETDLLDWEYELSGEYPYSLFFEDWFDEYTALAVLAEDDQLPKLFEDLELL